MTEEKGWVAADWFNEFRMTAFSLRGAAEHSGRSKSTIHRAIKSGRLSAERLNNGGYAIQPAELERVYPKKNETTTKLWRISMSVPSNLIGPLIELVEDDAVELKVEQLNK